MASCCILILLDGLGDRAFRELGHRTPLQAARTPNLDKIAALGGNGLFHAARPGVALPSENAHFAMFGYGRHEFPGRGYLEALGAGIPVAEDEVAVLAHFVSARERKSVLVLEKDRPEVSEAEAGELAAAIGCYKAAGFAARYLPTRRTDGIVVLQGRVSSRVTDTDPLREGEPLLEVLPFAGAGLWGRAQATAGFLKDYLVWCHETLSRHPVNQGREQKGLAPANALATQRPGRWKKAEPFSARWGMRGLSISSGLVYQGLSRYLGLDSLLVKDSARPGHDLAERLALALARQGRYDFIHVHTKAPDQAAHGKDPRRKVEVIEALDKGLDAVMQHCDDSGVFFMVTSDHSTPSGGPLVHSGEPVPLALVGPGVRRDRVEAFDEVRCAAGCLGMLTGRDLMPFVLNLLDRAKLQGLMDSPVDRPYWPSERTPFRLTTTLRSEERMRETGFIHGRFQVLHNDHLKYLLAGKARCRHLVVGITNPDSTLTSQDKADPRRSAPENNPLTYYERYCMVRDALVEAGLGLDEFSVVPFPVNFPELYHCYAPLDALFFLTIYDAWGEKKQQLFESLGLETEVLWRKPLAEKGLSAKFVRQRLAEGESWREFVPPAVAKLIERLDLPGRLQNIASTTKDSPSQE